VRLLLVGLSSLIVVTLASTAQVAAGDRDLIVYVRQDPRAGGLNDGVDLWVVGLRGGARRLVGSEGWDESPAWSPGGNRIAFVKSLFAPAGPDVVLRSADVWTVGVDGRSRRELTRNDSASSPVWSPDGRRLAFAHGNGVFLVRRDGSGRVRIARADDPGEPSWSPDGRRIAFTVPGEVRVADTNGGGARLLARGAESGSSVAWSPDCRLIGFTGTRRGVTGAFLVSAGGGRPRLLARGHLEPIWSPDGRTIAVVRQGAPRQAGLVLIAAGGGGPRRLTRGLDTEPVWSPDSRRLAFRRGLLTGDMYVVNADGGGLRNLTRTPRLDEREPAWRPPATTG
jgi:Tol biopolymer transport system component